MSIFDSLKKKSHANEINIMSCSGVCVLTINVRESAGSEPSRSESIITIMSFWRSSSSFSNSI